MMHTLTPCLKTAQQWMYALHILIMFSLTHLIGYVSHNNEKEKFCWPHKNMIPKWADDRELHTVNNLLYINKYSKGEEILHHQLAFQIFFVTLFFLISMQISCLDYFSNLGKRLHSILANMSERNASNKIFMSLHSSLTLP